MSWIDHAFVFLLLGILPIHGLWGYRKLERAIAAGVAGARMRDYVESIALLWLGGLGAVGIWLWQGRPATGIGLALPRGWPVVPAVAITIAIGWFLLAQLARVRRMTERPAEGIEAIDSVRALLPATDAELRTFMIAALSAGIFEEILYRGYLISYLDAYMPLWAAALLSSLAFAWGHIYQGLANLPRIFMLALLSAGLYLWTGSLLLPMILHAFIDINSVLTARAVLALPAAPEPTTPSATERPA